MLRRLLAPRWPEILVVLLGSALRLALAANYSVRLGYDFFDHARNVAWWMQHWQMPPIDWSRAAYHPPLYYMLAGALARTGVGFVGLGLLSLLLGCLRLALLAVGLELYLPGQRTARIAALGLAAFLPASVHMDVMLTNEPLAAALAMLALVLLPLTFADRERTRWRASIALGLVLGLAVLTKVSSLIILVALGATVVLELARRRDGAFRARLRRVVPPIAALVLALLCSGWYFAYCKVTYGKLFITGFDSWRSKDSLLNTDKPMWARRPPAYLFGCSSAIYRFPFYPSAALTDARFFPQLVATTFADYYNYGLAPYPGRDEPARLGNRRPLRPSVVAPAALSVAGGTVIAILVAVAWAAACLWCWRRRMHDMLGLLLVPALAIAGQAHFAFSVGNDAEGLVKGSYLQFAAAPLFALFGLALAWAWSRRGFRLVVPIAVLAWSGVAGYVVFCVFFAG